MTSGPDLPWGDHHGSATTDGNARVMHLRFDDGDEQTFHVGQLRRTELTMTPLSDNSPLGQALHGANLGDHIVYTAPGGRVGAVVVAITRG